MWRVTVCTDQIQQDEMGKLRSTYGEEKKYTEDFGGEEFRKRATSKSEA
jgi:hypothetical protein